MSDQREQLLKELKAGDSAALGELFALEQDRLERMVKFRLDPRLFGRVDPEDVLQEAYLAAGERLEHYLGDDTNSFFGWLRLIVGQTLIDIHRRHLGTQARDPRREQKKAQGPQTTAVTMAQYLAGNLTSPSQAAMKKEDCLKLQDCLEDMDEIDREVLCLRHFEELSNSEVAEVLDITPKAASMRYLRALKRLKDVMINDEPDQTESFS